MLIRPGVVEDMTKTRRFCELHNETNLDLKRMRPIMSVFTMLAILETRL
jgi:hypothetical protein